MEDSPIHFFSVRAEATAPFALWQAAAGKAAAFVRVVACSQLMFDGVCNLCDGFINFVAALWGQLGPRARLGIQNVRPSSPPEKFQVRLK